MLTERTGLLAATRVSTAAGTSLTLGGAEGRFFNQQQLTKGGAGTLVLDRLNNIAGLTVEDGELAGSGGVSGAVVLESGSALGVGDAADGAAVGSFRTNDFTLGLGGELLIGLDAAAGSGDLLDVAVPP